MANLAFIGLGTMGFPMAGHLVRAGHRVTVFNRTQATAERWLAELANTPTQKDVLSPNGRIAATPQAAAEGADVVMLCVGNDADVRSVTVGEAGVLAGMGSSSLLIDHTTASRQLAEELHEACRAQGVDFIDAPVSGGQAGAENGALTIMCGGEPAAFERAQVAFACYGKTVQLMGAVGSGQLAKMVNQICIAGVLQGLAEGVNFAQRAGLDIDKVVGALAGGAAQSWQMENRASTMAKDEFDFGFAVDWMRKDLGIALAEGQRLAAALPLTALVDQFYADVQRQGGSRNDTSSLIKRLR